MPTFATSHQGIVAARLAVARLEALVENTRYALVYATEDDEVDRLAAELTTARRDLRVECRALAAMEANTAGG